MHRTSVGIVLLTVCVLLAPPARAAHTVTPPSLSQEWVDNATKLVPDTDPTQAAQTLGVGIAGALNRGDSQAAANFVDTRALATRIAATMYTDPTQQQTFANGFGKWTVPQVFKMYHESLQQGHGSAKFDRVNAGFTIIENRVGTDAVTNTLREMFSQQAGAFTDAVKYGQKAVAIEPDLPRPWYFLGTSYVYVKNYPQAVASFQTLRTRFGVKLTRDQFGGPGWEGFTRSDAFKHWMPR